MKRINVTQSSMPPLEEYVEEIRSLFESKWLTNMGEKHKKFEEKLKEYLQVSNVSLTVNGHMALENIIKALDLKGEIITTPFTFASTTHAIIRCGLKPVFCDINRKDYTIDADKIEELITEDTCAILPVHVYGNVCNIEAIEEIANKYNLYVIYDAAHTFGEKYKGKSVAAYGDASVFSFHATKVFNTIEGGCIVFKDETMTTILKDIKNFGFSGPEIIRYVGGNAKMNEFQAAMGICNLRHIDCELKKRKNAYEKYREYLCDVKGLKIWEPQRDVEHNYAYMPVVFEEEFGKSRDYIAQILMENNIYARKYFYPITADFQCYNNKFSSCRLKVARDISNRVLTLPLYADIEPNDIERISSVILSTRQ